jgi:7-cyano-7-deazaguanine reductase
VTGHDDELTILRGDARGPIGPGSIETFAVPDLDEIAFTSDELAAVCPVTGQPDGYSLTIRYGPAGRAIESKSLKFYLWSFRDRGIFAERLTAEIADDVMTSATPNWVCVTLRQRPRGGIETTVTATRRAAAPPERSEQ